MSARTLPGEICNALQTTMDEVAGMAAGMSKRTKTGFLDSLLSPLNKDSNRIQIDQMNGKRRKVDVRYLPRVATDDVMTTAPADCTTTAERGYIEDQADITLYAGYDEIIAEDYIARICEGQTEHMQKIINSAFNAILEKIEIQLITAANASFGTNIATGSSAVKTLQILDATDDEKILLAKWFELIDTDLEDYNKFNSAPIIVGQGVMSRFNKQQGFGCCNDLGRDMGVLTSEAGYSFFKSQLMDATLGSNECIVYEPGALEFLQYLKYRDHAQDIINANGGAYGSFETIDGKIRGVIADPITGLQLDFKLIPNDCFDEYYMRIETEFDLYSLPTDQYDAADALSGSNGLLNYKFTNA